VFTCTYSVTGARAAMAEMDEQFSFVQWIGHSVSIATIGGFFAGFLPAIAILLPIIYYAIMVYESKTVRDFIRARRLRKLVHLRAQAVALELAIRNQNYNLQGLDEANQVHLAAAGKAADLTHDAVVVEQKAEVQKIAEADLKSQG
jgi:hypothetical protein